MDEILAAYAPASFSDSVFSLVGFIPAGVLLAACVWLVGWFVPFLFDLLRRYV